MSNILPSTTAMPTISLSELAKHNTAESAWISINNIVYDVTKFAPLHPAGRKILLEQCGKDASDLFKQFHSMDILKHKYGALRIGVIEGTTQQPQLSIPYAEQSWDQGWHSPYYNASHLKLKYAVREFLQRELTPYAAEWDESGTVPREIIKKCAAQGFFAAAAGKPWPIEYQEIRICGVELENYDSFHEYILLDELVRNTTVGCSGVLFQACNIGLPPLLRFGSKKLRDKYIPSILSGDKLICLAITEPNAGSDVANIQSRAEKSSCGTYYTLNGLKKWITSGVYSDLFTVCARTGEKGELTLLLVERGAGVTLRKIKTQGMNSSGSTFIIFENVRVPAENVIGKEGRGFQYCMKNFNHERLCVTMNAVRVIRNQLEDALYYAHLRRTFGKLLIEHPVIRAKLANMIRQTESLQCLLEINIYNFDNMDDFQKNSQLAASIALLKAQCSLTAEAVGRESCQIFGGRGYTRGTGLGGRAERQYREVKGVAIPGGSEEIMLELGIRINSKFMPQL